VPAGHASGVAALFSGPSGTGKTVAAEVVAGTLGLDLYLIDLASVVSKYIGETEQNLDKVFDAAAAGNVVLLFDEADALFGSRSAVSEAKDRYANIEVSYVLQRLERFSGLVVLTTNLANNIDPAFLRRLTSVIEFPMPGIEERVRLWERYLGEGMPLEEKGAGAVDVELLANTFDIAGGAIRNIAVATAFLAAQAGEPATMSMVMLAARRELQKMGRLIDGSDFDQWIDELGAPKPAPSRRRTG
jgi:SpoVK/Ycf46/Vps4 family AAA+-type ATPase